MRERDACQSTRGTRESMQPREGVRERERTRDSSSLRRFPHSRHKSSCKCRSMACSIPRSVACPSVLSVSARESKRESEQARKRDRDRARARERERERERARAHHPKVSARLETSFAHLTQMYMCTCMYVLVCVFVCVCVRACVPCTRARRAWVIRDCFSG
jgi:hypothetical protein